MKKSIITALLFLFSFSALMAQNFDYAFKESFNVNGDTELKLLTSDGFIHLTPNSGDRVEVYFIVRKNNRYIRIDRNELERELDLTIEQRGNQIIVEVRNRQVKWVNWRNQMDVSFEVFAPVNTSCNLRTSDGDIDMEGFIGGQYCKTSDGDVEIYDIEGPVIAHTSDGDITVRKIEGETECHTSDGDIQAFSIMGDAYFKTSDGDIYLENVVGQTEVGTSDGSIEFYKMSGGVTGGTSDGNIDGEIIDLYGPLKLSTSDGSIEVIIPDNLGLDIYLRGEKIYTDLINFSGNRSEHKIDGRMNGGGIPVSLSTSDGRISLKYR